MILKDKTPEQITDIIVGKSKKYPQFGFENFFISTADGKMFVSEGDKERMPEYIKRIKDMGIECSKLEELLPKYEEWRKLGSDDYHGYDEDGNEITPEDYYDDYDRKLKELQPLAEKFEEELKNISKKVVEKL
jgi:hypothetical protein